MKYFKERVQGDELYQCLAILSFLTYSMNLSTELKGCRV